MLRLAPLYFLAVVLIAVAFSLRLNPLPHVDPAHGPVLGVPAPAVLPAGATPPTEAGQTSLAPWRRSVIVGVLHQ